MVPINALYFYEKQLEDESEDDYTDEELEQAAYESYVNLQIKSAIEDID
jgi:hypothetical protein